jgi:hypothetical protein
MWLDQLKGPLLFNEWNGRSSRDVLLLNRKKAALGQDADPPVS